jgi:SAM-dependent methyltransferase
MLGTVRMGSGLWTSSAADDNQESPTLDTTVAHIARVYDYWLGGKDNFAADRVAGNEAVRAYPDMYMSVRQNRAFLRRAVAYLADAGIRQILDVGTGLPSANNTHEVAQAIAPESRVVYVDNDPIVLAHARALLTSAPQGATGYLDADARDTTKILAEAAKLLDFSQPVGVILIAILHLIGDGDSAKLVAELLAAVPPGSYLVISHVASDVQQQSPGVGDAAARLSVLMNQRITPRSTGQILRFFDGLELIDPGVVPVQRWRPASEAEASTRSAMRGGVARKR